MRINARLDEDQSKKLEYLMRSTGARVSDIVKEAIDVLYERAGQNASRPEALLTSCGFIGCGETGEGLSESYKDDLRESLLSKHKLADDQ